MYLWVDDLPWSPTRTYVEEEGPDATVISDDLLHVIHPMPVLKAGTYLLALGTDTERKTATVEVEVTVPARRYPQAQAAAIWAGGLRALTTETRQMMSGDPRARAGLEDLLGAPVHVAIEDVLAELGTYATTVEADYLALPDEDEAGVQAFLVNSGLLPMFEELSTPRVMPRLGPVPDGVITLADRLNHPVSKALWTLDGAGAALGTISDALTVVNVIAVLTGGPGLSIALPAKITIVILRVIVDSVLPTDLRSVEVHGQPRVYTGEASRWIFWGTFEPQNGVAGTAISIIDQSIGLALSESTRVVSTAFRSKLADDLARDLLSRVTRFAFPNCVKLTDLLGEGILSGDTARLWRIKTIVNMQAYNLTVGDIATLNPVLGPAMKFLSYVLADWELVSPFSLRGTTAFAVDAEWHFGYGEDAGWVSETNFPTTGQHDALATLTTQFYRFKNKFAIIFNPPWIEWGEVDYAFDVRDRPDTSNPNEKVADEVFTQTSFAPTAVDTFEDWLIESTSTARTITLTIEDLIFFNGGQAQIDLLVNGTPVQTMMLVPDDPTTLQLPARPGLNTIEIRAVTGHSIPHSATGRMLALEVKLPYVDNTNVTKGVFLNPTQAYTLKVWTPPAFGPP